MSSFIHEPSDAEQDAMLKKLAKAQKKLLKFEGAHYVDVGAEYKDGRPTGRLALRVHVHEKKAKEALAAAEVLPAEMEGLPVDVIESNPELHGPRAARHDPLVGGVAAGNARIGGGGTLGTIVYDTETLQPMVLSNHHVFHDSQGQFGDPIAQPNDGDEKNVIGRLQRWDLGSDSAVAMLTSRRGLPSIHDFAAGIDGSAFPKIGMAVTKSGATTGTTSGVIDGVSTGEFTIVPDPNNPAPNGEISSPGDSGSVWFETSTRRAVGLHFAGETDPDPANERARSKWMNVVLSTLDIQVFRDPAIASNPTLIGFHGSVMARTTPGADCDLQVTYPSGRRSKAKGLGPKTADANGIVTWSWRVGTSTKMAGTGGGGQRPAMGQLRLGDQQAQVSIFLAGPPPPIDPDG